MKRPSALLVRYGEIGLKGGNRPAFEKALCENLRRALEGVPGLTIRRTRGRILVRADRPAEEYLPRAARVFGVSSLSPVHGASLDLDAIRERGRAEVASALERDFPGADPVPFRVSVNRANKGFRTHSADAARMVADAVLAEQPRLRVDLSHPHLNLEVDLREDAAWIFARRVPGPGGLPVGSVGRALCLLSGGIDSPVAAWMTMKRGVRVDLVSFYSFPFVGPQTREKILRLAEILAEWQSSARLHLVPFADLQLAVRDHAPEEYRTLLYRRAMQRIASRLARRTRCRALVTGESLGQVASQTMHNMAVIEDASSLPVLRPLVGMDKEEAVALARRIGTLEASNLPAPDCCTVFQPAHPVIHGSIEAAREAEADFDAEALAAEAAAGTETLRIPEEA